MSSPQVSAPAEAIDPLPAHQSSVLPRSPSPSHSHASLPSLQRSEQVQDRHDMMDHEPTSPPNGAGDSPAHIEGGTNNANEEDMQDEMQLDNNDSTHIPMLPPPLPSISQILPSFGLNTRDGDLLAPPIFSESLHLPVPHNTIPRHDLQTPERDVPTPPPPPADNSQPPLSDDPPAPADLPPPPNVDEEEDDFDGQAQFLQHFSEDKSEPPPEELEEITRQERSGNRTSQLSGLKDSHWTKQVETSIDDPAFLPLEQGKFTWDLDKFHGTKDAPNKERIMRSPTFNIGGFKWNIKLFPHGCESTDYVSVYIECGGRVDESSSETTQPWDVAAQIGCVMYNPSEPRTYHFERASHHFESGSPDWGWVRFYGPWQELHIRRFLTYRPMLQNDKISLTAYIRVWEDPTKLLWSTNLKSRSWDSFQQTGFRGLSADGGTATAFISAMSLLMHCSAFNETVAAAPLVDSVRRPELQSNSMTQGLKSLLRRWHDPEGRSSTESLDNIQNIFNWYGYDFNDSTDILQIWQALSQIMAIEEANCISSGLQSRPTSAKAIATIRQRQPPAVFDMDIMAPHRKEYKSVQELFSETSKDRAAFCETLFGQESSDGAMPDVIAIELKRSKFDTRKRKWCKLTHHVKIDQVISANSKTYCLRGAVIHRGELGLGDFYSVVRPAGSSNWLKYRNGQASFLTPKQAIDIHEGKGETRVSTDSIAYVLVYALEDDPSLFPTRDVIKSQGLFARLAQDITPIRADEPMPIVVHDAKYVTDHHGLGFVDPWKPDNPYAITFNMRASSTLADVQGELFDRLKGSNRAEKREQIRLWPIKTTTIAPRFVLGLDGVHWPDTQLLDFADDNGGAHLWLEIIPLDTLETNASQRSRELETNATSSTTAPPPPPGDAHDVVMANTEDEASDSDSGHDDDDDEDEDDDGSSTSMHLEWELIGQFYVILKTWNPQLLRLTCQGTYFVPEGKQNVLEFVRKTLKIPNSQRLKVYQETGPVLEKELSPSFEFRKLDSLHNDNKFVVLVVSPELPDKIQEQRRKAGEPTAAPDWYKILQDRQNPAYKQLRVIQDYFGGPYVSYTSSSTLPRPKSIVVGTKGDAFMGDLDMNWIKNGQGTMIYTNGNKYEGEWKDDLPEGNGTMTYVPSGNKYEGGWMAGRRHGKGIMYYEESEDQLRTCKICYEEEMNTVLVKCGHIVACHLCARELKECPVCRGTVQDVVRMWPTV